MQELYDEQLSRLNKMLIEMGASAENAIKETRVALINQDIELARSIISRDNEIDRQERDIESLCLKLLLLRHPIASDFRMISAALKMITDIERIGDHAQDISEVLIMIAGSPYIKKLEHIPQMADACMRMVTLAIDAYVKKNPDLAYYVIDCDDYVDDLFVTVKNDLIALILENPQNGEQAIDLIMIAKYFERIGDHAVNIAEWVVFSILGHKPKPQG